MSLKQYLANRLVCCHEYLLLKVNGLVELGVSLNLFHLVVEALYVEDSDLGQLDILVALLGLRLLTALLAPIHVVYHVFVKVVVQTPREGVFVLQRHRHVRATGH